MGRTDFSPPPGDGPVRQGMEAMIRARAFLVMERPFFATFALRLSLTEDEACRDLWTDGKVLAFNPVFAAAMPRDKLVGAQAHAVMHLTCGHHARRKGRDETLWNRACDYVVNQILLDAGFALPRGFLHDPLYAGRSVDDIYSALYKLRERESDNGTKDNGESGAGGPEKASALKLFPDDERSGDDQANGAWGEDEKGKAGRGPEKNGGNTALNSDGTPKINARQPWTRTFVGEVRDHPALGGTGSSSAQKTAEREADIAVTQALQRALHMGDVPAGFSRMLKKSVQPVLDWRELLRRFLERQESGDYAWTSPNRRYIHQNIYLPSRREAHLPQLALAVDSSGSVDEASLAAFCAELSSVLEAYDSTLTVLFHDATVQDVLTLTRLDMPFSLTPVGGGGTDYRPVCAYLEEQVIRPSCLIWFTDLECDRFPEKPPYPVLWV